MASRPKTIALTVAVAAPETTARAASAATLETNGIATSTTPPAARAPTSTGSEADAVPEHATEWRDHPADQGRRAHHERDRRGQARPGAGEPLDEHREYGRVIWVARNDTPKIRKMRRTTGSASTPRTAPNARSITRPPAG